MKLTNLTFQKKILRQLFVKEKFIIDQVDGTQTFVNSSEVFKRGIDMSITKWVRNYPVMPTPDTEVKIYEMISDANLKQMYYSVSNKIDDLCLSQHQIINFCKKYPKALRDNQRATFFLFRDTINYYVAYTRVFQESSSLSLDIHFLRIETDYLWIARFARRVVIPCIKKNI